MENLQEENSNSGGIKYENTYKLEPTKGGFPVKLLNIMLEEVLTDILEDQVYEQDNCPRFTKSISEIIKTKAKDLIDPRYKVICGTQNTITLRVWCTKTLRFLQSAQFTEFITINI